MVSGENNNMSVMATSSVGEAGTVYAPQHRGKAGIRVHVQFVIGPD
jgi:hypothetical protein